MEIKPFCYALVGVLFAIVTTSHAQARLERKADKAFKEYSFNSAIDIYESLLEKGYTNVEILCKLGDAYYFNAEYDKAAATYEILVAKYADSMQPEYWFRYAQALKSVEEYPRADSVMQIFYAEAPTNLYGEAVNYGRTRTKGIVGDAEAYTIAPSPINTIFSEYAPSYYKEGLLFASNRDTGMIRKDLHSWNSQVFSDLYQIDRAESTDGVAEKFGGKLNSRFYESTTAMTPGGDTLYFTRSNLFKGKRLIKDERGVVRLKIYRSFLQADGSWSEPESLPFNEDSYSVANPALSPDGKTLYFASDMPGTIGSSDLYRVTIGPNGNFGEPENLGTGINTPSRETFPFIAADGMLYFSSDGHPGLGGLDIFGSKLDETGNPLFIVNLGAPVNSNMDDFTFIFNAAAKLGYFASNREGGMGEDDIYAVTQLHSLFECEAVISGWVRNAHSGEGVAGATVVVLDGENNQLMEVVTDASGRYQLDMACLNGIFLRAKHPDYEISEQMITAGDFPKAVDIALAPLEVQASYGDDLAQILGLSTIYFDFEQYTISEDSKVEIEKVIAAMEKYPDLNIKVNAHTDSRGADAYNRWLSQKRAEATVAYMEAQGIAVERLQWEGFGETQLINPCANGVSCTPEQHQANRRSEFIVWK